MAKQPKQAKIPLELIERLFRSQLDAESRGLFKDNANLGLFLSISRVTSFRRKPMYTIPISFPDLFKNKSSYELILNVLKNLKYVDKKTLKWKPGFGNRVAIGLLKELQKKKYFKNDYNNIELSLIAKRFFGLELNENHFKGNKYPTTDTKSIPTCTS